MIILKEIQYLINKGLQVIINMADGAISADKDSVVISAKEIVRKAIDAVVVLGHANSKLSSRRRSALKKLFNTDTQAVCDNAAIPPSKFLFGDDFGKHLREAKDEATLARSCTSKPQLFNNNHNTTQQSQNRRSYGKPPPVGSETQTRRPNFPPRQQPNKPFLYRGKKSNHPPWRQPRPRN